MTQHRIALVSAFPPGTLSLNEYGLHFARHLAARSDVREVIVLADILSAQAQELDLGPKITVRRVWRYNSWTASAAIIRALGAERVDGAVFNLQTTTFGDREVAAALGLAAPMLTRWVGVPSGVIAHNLISGVDLEQTILKGQPLRQAIVRLGGSIVTGLMMRASYVTTTLQGYADALRSSYPRADVTLVPHGTFDTSERPWKPHAERPMRLVTMGKFGTYKRLETLLAAFDLVRETHGFPDLQLVVGGTDHPNAAGYVAGIAESRKGDPGVIFAGYVPEEAVPEFFENARASVFDYESTTGSSGVLHQTASYGATPIFPHIGDFVDICRDEGLQGYDYAPCDAADMARTIAGALRDIGQSENLARANRSAAQGMPLSDVVGFHMDRLGAIWARSGEARAKGHFTPVDTKG